MRQQHLSYWETVWKQFKRHRLGCLALMVVSLFVIAGIYAPLLASNKPLVVQFEGYWYFPLFRYLFYSGFFSKRLDLFYNLFMFTFPLFIGVWIGLKSHPQKRVNAFIALVVLQFGLFVYLILFPPRDPTFSPDLIQLRRQEMIERRDYLSHGSLLTPPPLSNWSNELLQMTPYRRLNLVLKYQQQKLQHLKQQKYEKPYLIAIGGTEAGVNPFPTAWNLIYQREKTEMAQLAEDNEAAKEKYLKNKQTLMLSEEICKGL